MDTKIQRSGDSRTSDRPNDIVIAQNIREIRDLKIQIAARSAVQSLLEGCVMSLVRLLGFTTLGCGCVVGRYREVATSREVSYVEEKGKACGSHAHRRNHTVSSGRLSGSMPLTLTAKAS
jgi:hypothetical protein